MLIFESITIKNFMAVGNHPITIDYTKNETTLVSAKNGTGKSAIFLEALSFVLFDKPYRKGRKGQLVNNINGKETLVEINFSSGETKFKVRRGIKPNVFEIYRDGVLLNQSDTIKDYQKILERQILKMNFKTFSQVMIMGSGNYVPFMRLDAAGRREFIEDLLDIRVFSVMNTILKKKVKDTKEEGEILKAKFSAAEEKYRTIKHYLTKIQQDQSTEEKRLEDERALIEKKITDTNMSLEPHYMVVESHNWEVLKTAQSKMAELKMKIQFEQKKRTEIEQGVIGLKVGDSCPSCLSTITEDHLANLESEIRSKLSEIDAKLVKMLASMERGKQIIGDLTKKEEVALVSQKAIQEGESTIKALKYALASIKPARHDDTKIQEEQEKLKSIMTEAKDIRGAIIKNEVELKAQEYMLGLLKDTGVKAKIVKQYLPVLNHYITMYLQKLGFKITFEMAEDFSETVKSDGTGAVGYDMFSEGEKQRVDLAMMFAFREIARLKNSVCTNLLIMDEILDMSLDEVGVANFFSIINEMEGTNLFVISHREGMQDKFEGHIRLVKKNNYACLT